MKRILTILFLINSLLLQAQVRHYVSTSGTNSGTGHTQGAPWQTLAYAEANATTAGDTICLKKGDTWSFTNVFEITHGGNGGTYITWDGSLWGSGANAIIKSNNVDPYGSLLHIAACDYLKIQNITFLGDNDNVNGITIGGNENVVGPTAQSNEDHIIIRSCTVQNFGAGTNYNIAILVQAMYTTMSDITVDSCTVNSANSHGICVYANRYSGLTRSCNNVYIGYNSVTNCGRYSSGPANAIFLNNRIIGVIVEHNTVTEGSYNSFGIAISHNTGNDEDIVTGAIVRYNSFMMDESNVFYMNGGGAITADVYYNIFYCGNGDDYVSSMSMTGGAGGIYHVYNNVCIMGGNGNNSTGGSMYYGGTLTLRNNIFLHTGTGTNNYAFQTGQSITHTNNLYYRTSVGNINYVYYVTAITRDNVISTWEATSQNTNPTFVTNYTDLNLQAGSPAINKGIGVGLNEDFNGDTLDINPDIGIQEYGSGPPDVPPDLPTVTTSTPAIVYSRLAIAGGNVTSDGGGTVSTRGVCWSTSINPSTSDSKIAHGTGMGAWTDYIPNLTANTTYHVRSYATNATGTSYGADLTFTTPVHSVAKTGGKILKYNNKIVIIH